MDMHITLSAQRRRQNPNRRAALRREPGPSADWLTYLGRRLPIRRGFGHHVSDVGVTAGSTFVRSLIATAARWSADNSRAIDATLVQNALAMATRNREPVPGGLFTSAVMASRNSQRMSRSANCWDNAIAESSFARLTSDDVRASWPIYAYLEVFKPHPHPLAPRHGAMNFEKPSLRVAGASSTKCCAIQLYTVAPLHDDQFYRVMYLHMAAPVAIEQVRQTAGEDAMIIVNRIFR